jgi:voltage-gated potassium channel
VISRHRVWQLVEPPREGEEADWFDVFILLLIALNVVAVILQSVRSLDARFAGFFSAFEVFSVGVFSLEYVARIWSCVEDARYSRPLVGRLRCATRPLVLIDLAAILPFFVTYATVDLTILRAARLFRLVRLLKATRYVTAMQLFRRVFHSKREELVLTTALMLVLLIMASSLIYVAENPAQPDKFSSIPASMWWAVATLTTVGYGDVYPVTPLGKLAGGFVAILGIGFFALPTAIIGSGFIEAIQERRKAPVCPHCGRALH